MALQTLAQQRAKHAWNAVERARTLADFDKEFVDPAKKMPVRIRTSGLGQTIAYLRAKKEAAQVRGALADWCHKRGLIPRNHEDELLVQFKDGSAASLWQFTAEALAYLEWLQGSRMPTGRRNRRCRLYLLTAQCIPGCFWINGTIGGRKNPSRELSPTGRSTNKPSVTSTNFRASSLSGLRKPFTIKPCWTAPGRAFRKPLLRSGLKAGAGGPPAS